MTCYKVLDLFSGIGGFSLGLERAGMQTVAFCEIDPFCRNVLQKHWPGVPVFDDVKDLTKRKLYEIGIQRIDVICGGFPCQDISAAGHGAGLNGARSSLWSEMRRLIAALQPGYVLIENVSRLRSNGLGTVLRDLWQVGYDAQWHCIPASALGAPHRRDRIWILAYPAGNRLYGRTALQDRAGCFIPGMVAQSGRGRTAGACRAMAENGGTQTLTAHIIRGLIKRQHPQTDWQTKPQPVALVDGISTALDRFAWKNAIKAYGNAVVPHIPEMLGKALRIRGQMILFAAERFGVDASGL